MTESDSLTIARVAADLLLTALAHISPGQLTEADADLLATLVLSS
jgi:hypothetical protein